MRSVRCFPSRSFGRACRHSAQAEAKRPKSAQAPPNSPCNATKEVLQADAAMITMIALISRGLKNG
jgi:hypothetical protein